MPVRVLQVFDNLGMGGAETWVMNLLRHWSTTNRVELDFLLTGDASGLFESEARQLGAKIFRAPFKRGDLSAFVEPFRKVLKENTYQAVHDHQDYASGWHFLFGVGLLPPVRVTHVHNPWIHIEANYGITKTRRNIARMGKFLVRRLATHVCGTSTEVLDRYGLNEPTFRSFKSGVLHCGFPIREFSGDVDQDRISVRNEFGWSADSKLVLFAGRLDRAIDFNDPQNHKNSWFALNVFREACKLDPTLRLIMAGASSSAGPMLESYLRDWRLHDKALLVGVRKDLPRLMRGADLLLFPSREEGLGMVAVEAQAASLPVLASTAVPPECVVIPELYEALSLNEPIEHWASTLLASIRRPRMKPYECREALENSPFSIEDSASRLEKIYGVHQ